MTAADHVAAFLDAMRAAGVEAAESIAGKLALGERVRFQCVGDTRGRKNGWARLHLDGRPAGAFGSYKGDLCVTWRADRDGPRPSPAERLAARLKAAAERDARAAEQAAAHERAAEEAATLLQRAVPAEPGHPYLARKRIAGEALFRSDGVLLVPMRDGDGRLWNVQRIFPDGAKRFLRGGRIAGLFWTAGDDAGPLCIGEGVGTVAAVRRATGHAVAAAMSKGNLEPVARLLRARWPERRIIMCADNDAHLIRNPRIGRNLGLDAARAAAAAIGASVVLPSWSADND